MLFNPALPCGFSFKLSKNMRVSKILNNSWKMFRDLEIYHSLFQSETRSQLRKKNAHDLDKSLKMNLQICNL